jgi:hypothetical protein
MKTLSPNPAPVPIAAITEAEALAAHFMAVMDALVDLVRRETELVRAGRVGEAMKLEQSKSALAQSYIATMLRLQADRSRLGGMLRTETLSALRQRHESFRALLQLNLTVLATAHAVSEGIVRGVSEEIARKSMPQTYGASGRATVPSRSPTVPLAVSRLL